MVTTLIFTLLTYIHRKPARVAFELEKSGIRLESINSQEEESAQTEKSNIPNLASLLPSTPQQEIIPIEIDTPDIDVSVNIEQMIEWRYNYADIGGNNSLASSFGVSNFLDIDEMIKNIITPPKKFPDELIDAGITEGRVIVSLLIDEKGHVEVKNVHSATHRLLVPIVVEAMENAVYSIPVKNGRPTKTVIKREIHFQADPKHVEKRRAQNSI